MEPHVPGSSPARHLDSLVRTSATITILFENVYTFHDRFFAAWVSHSFVLTETAARPMTSRGRRQVTIRVGGGVAVRTFVPRDCRSVGMGGAAAMASVRVA